MPVHPSKDVTVTDIVELVEGITVSVGIQQKELDQINVVPVISELSFISVL